MTLSKGACILAVDPGKDKTGLAVLMGNGSIVERKVAPSFSVTDNNSALAIKHGTELVIIGSGGPFRQLEKKLAFLNLKADIIFVNEKGSTLEARKLYWRHNRKKWYLSLIPSTLILPPEPYDDFAAVVIGRRYLKAK